MNIESIDDKLYKSLFGLTIVGNYTEIWNEIKSNNKILKEAVKIKKDKFNEKDIVNGLTISYAMLIDYESVDKEAYNSLIDAIYSNKDIARIVMNGASNGGFSYLLLSLFNHNLKLTDKQKEFAINEAMNKTGTILWEQRRNEFYEKIDKKGITDDKITYITVSCSTNPIGEKTALEYMNNMFDSMSNIQAHGVGEFDIRYHILRNPNWSISEKQKLIMDFWINDESYLECLEQWEWNIVNDLANIKGYIILEREYLYEFSYEDLLNLYNDKKTIDIIWNEIMFCKLMRELRPPKYEDEYQKIIKY